MTLVITATNQDLNRWDHYVLEHPNGNAYQLFAWKQAIEKAYKFNGKYLIAEENGQIKGILPLVWVKIPFLNNCIVSLPYCDAGGPLADSPEIENKLLLKALALSEEWTTKTVSIRCTLPMAMIDEKFSINHTKVRLVLNLPENSDLLMASFKSKLRSQIKKPVRDGLTVESGHLELLDEFYDVFAENMRDLGSPVHSKKWFKHILIEFNKKCRLFLVRMPDQTPAAGGILLCHTHTISVPWASSLKRFNRWNPNMLLYWGFLQYASDNGFKRFDFGRSTPEEGTFRFKQQWGAVPQSLHWCDFKPGTDSVQDLLIHHTAEQQGHSRLRKIAASMIMKMPVSMSTALGQITRKYITL